MIYMINTRNDSKLSTKDIITLGIFSVLFSVVLFLFAAVMGIFPVAFVFYSAVGAIPCGIIYMYVITKISKRGTIVIMTTVISIIYFLIGTYGLAPLYGIVGGIIAELISYSSKYKSFWKNTIGYTVYTTCLWFGFMSPMILSTNSYIEKTLAAGYAQDHIVSMVNFITGPLFFVALGATIVGGVLGGLFGRKMHEKHFEKV